MGGRGRKRIPILFLYEYELVISYDGLPDRIFYSSSYLHSAGELGYPFKEVDQWGNTIWLAPTIWYNWLDSAWESKYPRKFPNEKVMLMRRFINIDQPIASRNLLWFNQANDVVIRNIRKREGFDLHYDRLISNNLPNDRTW